MNNKLTLLEIHYNDPVFGGSKYTSRVGIFEDKEILRKYKLINPLENHYFYEEVSVSLITSL